MYGNIFDSHAHYNDSQFDEDRYSVLSSLPDAGICGIVNCATDIKSCEDSRKLSGDFDFIYFAAGIHPEDCDNLPGNYKDILKKYLSEKKCVAVGEIGLDYHYDFVPRDIQKKVFEEQLILAKELDMPVIIHDREAHMDIWNLLNKYRPKGIVHCFSGSREMARDVVSIGMYIGLGGAVTFKNAKKPVEVAEYVPADRIVLETDCPYMSPVPKRGKRNDSSNIAFTAEFISNLKNIPVQEFIDITTENSKAVFGL